MTRLFTKTSAAIATCALGLLGTPAQQTKACNLTDLTLISYTDNGTSFTIDVTLCVGFGITGFVQGADQLTGTFAAFFYAPDPPNAITILSTGPAAITSSYRGCTLFNTGGLGALPGCFSPDPCGPPYYNDIDEAVYFTDSFCDQVGYGPCLPPCDLGFTCILTTALCGNVNQDCFNLTFETDILPDSVRIVGAEGAGQAFTGCFPNPDMHIDFTTLPVQWGNVAGKSLPGANQITWSTTKEYGSRGFEVLRADDWGVFEVIGEVPSQGDGTSKREYAFIDPKPRQGSNLYRVRQLDFSGHTEVSRIVELAYTAPSGLAWAAVGPVPTTGPLDMAFTSELGRSMTLSVSDLSGRQVMSRPLQVQAGLNSQSLDLAGLRPGVYNVTISGADGKLEKKITKL